MAQKYRIKTIRYAGAFDYILDTNNGLYVFGEHKKHINDLLFDYNSFKCRIITIVRVPQKNISEMEFTIGDMIQLHSGRKAITNIFFELGDPILRCGNGVQDRVRLLNAVKIVPVIKEEVATKTVKKATTTKKVVKKETNPFQSIEDTIVKSFNGRQIRLEKTLKERKETLKEFLIKYYVDWNKAAIEDKKDTIWVDDDTIQTKAGKRRSLGDLYMIAKYYYPNTTLKDLVKILFVDFVTEFPHYRSSYCWGTSKRMFYYAGTQTTGIYDKEQLDEYGKKWDWYIINLK